MCELKNDISNLILKNREGSSKQTRYYHIYLLLQLKFFNSRCSK